MPVFSESVGFQLRTLSISGGAVSWDGSLGNIYTLTLTGNATMNAPTNLAVGCYILHVIQGTGGNKTITWNSVFKWPQGVPPVLSTAQGARDVFSFVSDGTNMYGSYIRGVA